MEDSIADQIINGECCALCTIPFKKDHGYPVACNECYDNDYGYSQAIYSRIDNNEASVRRIDTTAQQKLNGIIKFINKGLNITKKGDGTWGFILADYMNQYFPENEVPPQEPELAAIEVQKDFGAFVKWFKENRNKYRK